VSNLFGRAWNAGNTKVEQKRRAPQPVIPPEKGAARKVEDLSKSMSIDELWGLHLEISATLVAKITAEKEVIDDRLKAAQPSSERRKRKPPRWLTVPEPSNLGNDDPSALLVSASWPIAAEIKRVLRLV